MSYITPKREPLLEPKVNERYNFSVLLFHYALSFQSWRSRRFQLTFPSPGDGNPQRQVWHFFRFPFFFIFPRMRLLSLFLFICYFPLFWFFRRTLILITFKNVLWRLSSLLRRDSWSGERGEGGRGMIVTRVLHTIIFPPLPASKQTAVKQEVSVEKREGSPRCRIFSSYCVVF